MLEEIDRIDMIGTDPDGRIILVITDAGITTDPEKRFALLIEKIRTCVGYAVSDQFAKDNPGKAASDVRIEVTCANPPTERMAKLTSISPAAQRDLKIPITYTHLPAKF